MANKIPLKTMLGAIDRNDFDFYSSMTDDQRKDFSPWLAMRYASSGNKGYDAIHYLLMVNDLVNRDFSSLKEHPELQWKLMATCGTGSNCFHPWIAPGKRKKKDKLADALRKVYPTLRKSELELLCKINSKDDLKQMMADRGLSNDEIKEVLK